MYLAIEKDFSVLPVTVPVTIIVFYVKSLNHLISPRSLLSLRDIKATQYACMVLHNCLSPAVVTTLVQSPVGVDIAVAILRHLVDHDTEWG